VKRRAFRDWEYGESRASFGDPSRILILASPRRPRSNRTGRMFTGDRSGDCSTAPPPDRLRSQPASVSRHDAWRSAMLYHRRRPRAPPAKAHPESFHCRPYWNANWIC